MNILRLADFPTRDVLMKRSHEIETHGLGITHIFPLSKELISMNNHVSVLTGGGLRYPFHERISGVDVYRTRLSMKPYYLALGPALLSNIKKIESETGMVDVLHSHNPPLSYGYCFVKQFVRKPIVATIHGTFCYDFFEKNIFLKMMVSHVDHFIAINVPSVDILKQIGVTEDNISLIPTGVDTDVFRNTGEKEMIVLYAGRLVAWKNVDVVIEMAAAVKDSHPNLKFYIVGRGEREAALRKRAAKIGLRNVFFITNARYEDMPAFYSKASVMLAPHKFDSFGKTVLEALACETPVVGTDFDVPPDIKRCGVFLSNPDDVSGMVKAMIELIENEVLRTKLGRLGRDTVVKRYTWKKCAERSLRVYRKVI